MNDEQKLVVEHIVGPAAVLAGAGSGKTYTLIERIKNLVKLTSPNRIVMLTFTNEAARQMTERAAAADPKCKQVIATTYHKYFKKILVEYGSRIGISPHVQVMSTNEYKDLIDYVKNADDEFSELKDFPSASLCCTLFSKIDNDEDASIQSLVSGTRYSKDANEINSLYVKVKEAAFASQRLCFDDILVYTSRLLEHHDICEKIAKSFDYLMVDEFQDTNALQLDVLLKLSKYNNNIVIVGDVSQSIYKFRGAKVENIQQFIDSFDCCDVFSLSYNYRSTQEILDATNDIMRRNVESWTYTNMKAVNKHGDLPLLCTHRDDYSQADWIIRKIKNCLSKGYLYKQIAIIQRKSMSSIRLENELVKHKIPYRKVGGRKFADYVCVNDMISFLSIISRKDKFCWFKVLRLIPGIGNKTATKLAEQCKNADFLDSYKSKKAAPYIEELKARLADFRQHKKDLDNLFVKVTDYYVYLREYVIENSKKNNDSKALEYERLDKDKLIIKALRDIAATYNSLSEFLDDIALDTLNKEEEVEDQITITTIHSAKGLEWPVVILIDPIDTDVAYTESEEELRCLYVAMTRAEEDLTLSIPDYKIMNGVPTYNNFIHFIDNSRLFFDEV